MWLHNFITWLASGNHPVPFWLHCKLPKTSDTSPKQVPCGKRSSAAEVRFGPVHGPKFVNPEPDQWSSSSKEAEPWTGPLWTRLEGFSSSSEHIRTLEPFISICKKSKKFTRQQSQICTLRTATPRSQRRGYHKERKTLPGLLPRYDLVCMHSSVIEEPQTLLAANNCDAWFQ
jgi:hypothetical protein